MSFGLGKRIISDYDDTQFPLYESDFVSDMHKKMQVPERISVQEEVGPGGESIQVAAAQSMTVPEKILVAGQNKHVGMEKYQLRQFDLDTALPANGTYVSLVTPPRVMTLDELTYPCVDELTNQSSDAASFNDDTIETNAPVPQSLLLPENSSDVVRLQRQMNKLSHRVSDLVHENEQRRNRELILYPVLIGYFLIKILRWMFHT